MLTPHAKHRPRLVLFHRLSSICNTIRLFKFRWIRTKKGWQVGIKIAVRKQLVVQAGALLINAVFCNRRMRWEVGKDEVVSGCGLSGMLLDGDKWDHVMRLHGHDITIKKTLIFVQSQKLQKNYFLSFETTWPFAHRISTTPKSFKSDPIKKKLNLEAMI